MKTLITCLSLLVLSPASTADEKKIAVSFYCPAYAEGLRSVFVKTSNGSYRSIGLSTANVIDGAEITAVDGVISLHGPAGADDTLPVVASAAIASIREPLLVLVPADEDGQIGYQVTVVEKAHSGFPLGGYKLVNLSPHPVRVNLGNDVIEIESGEQSLFKPDVEAGEVVAVTIDHKIDGHWRLVSSARWASRSDRRTLVCFQLDPASKRMGIKTIPLRETSN